MRDDVSTAASDDPPPARELRERLVRIIAQTVRDRRVLAAMQAVPRHLFVAEPDLERAYADHPLPIGHAATISQPTVVGIMSEALLLTGKERVLEVGTGSGYQAAVLARLTAHIDTVEVVPELATRAARVLHTLGCTNVEVHLGDGWGGWPAGAPYNRIVVTAAPDILPSGLFDQLRDGGLLLVPVGSQERDQRLERWRKSGADWTKEDLGAVRFVPMVRAAETCS